jgi:hypothetical protein
MSAAAPSSLDSNALAIRLAELAGEEREVHEGEFRPVHISWR